MSMIVCSLVKISYVENFRSSLLMPKPVEAFPWGSKSMISTFSPAPAIAQPRLIAVVVFPTPPFWLANANILALLLFFFNPNIIFVQY